MHWLKKCQLHRCQITRPILKIHVMNVFKVILHLMTRNAFAVNRACEQTLRGDCTNPNAGANIILESNI